MIIPKPGCGFLSKKLGDEDFSGWFNYLSDYLSIFFPGRHLNIFEDLFGLAEPPIVEISCVSFGTPEI